VDVFLGEKLAAELALPTKGKVRKREDVRSLLALMSIAVTRGDVRCMCE
jgi:hypothetical protein